MKYTEILEELKERGASKIQPFTPIEKLEDEEDKRLIVLPDSLPVNLNDPIYKAINTEPIGGLTYEGYAWIDAQGIVGLSGLDLDPDADVVYLNDKEQQEALNEIKEFYVSPVFGFDNDCINPIELNGLEGERYLTKELKKLIKKEK